MKRYVSLILLFFYAVTALGCAVSEEPKIIGKWVCKTTGDRMELSKGHACTLDSMGFHYSCTWTVSKSDIKVEAGQIVLKGSFDGNNIVVEDAVMHSKYIFEKVAETKR